MSAYAGAAYGEPAVAAVTAQATPTITLEVIRAFDERLPGLTDADMKQVLDVAEKTIASKLSDEIKIVFHDNGEVSLDSFFKSVPYQNDGSYPKWMQWKYDTALGEKMPVFKDDSYKAKVVEFLKQWDLNSLKDFFPGEATNSYEDAFNNLMAVYHQKIKWLKTLKTKAGEPLVIGPPAPYQSYVEWGALMNAQDKYDIVITNGLIIYDYLPEPYPHSICKHAKVGGSSFNSPKRKPLEGKSLMANIFESYGQVEGITKPDGAISEDLKNNIIGVYYFAHEFGHAFFYLPDVYDHGPSCLMNSTPGMSDVDGYNAVVADPHPCPKCRPWIAARLKAFRAGSAFDAGDFSTAGKLYLEAALETPENTDTNYHYYINSLCSKADEAFMKVNDFAGIKKCGELTKKLEKK